jgi:hypothetical protein
MGFEDTVCAMVETIARERSSAWSAETSRNFVAPFVLGQYARSPDYLRFPLRLATIVFSLASIPRCGCRFHRLPHQQRWAQLQRWRHSRLTPFRDLIKFYESLAVFGVYAEQYSPSKREWLPPEAPQ